jgi:hypothetical protein
MRRLTVLLTVALLMMAMLVASAGGAQGLASGTIKIDRTPSGVAVAPAACELFADGSSGFAWRPGGACWFTPPL